MPPSVRLSAWNNSAPTGWIFMKFEIWVYFENMSRKLKFDRSRLYVKTNIRYWPYLAQFFLEWILFQTRLVEKITTHKLYSIYIYIYIEREREREREYRAVNEIMWKTILEPGRKNTKIRRMGMACGIPKSTNTHSEYVVLTDFVL